MNGKPLVLVTGATGQHGGAVARQLLKDNFVVRALTRNTAAPAAQRLQAAGAQLAAGDMTDRASLDHALAGVQGVFAVQDFWARGVGAAGEVAQGKNLADAAKAAGVTHFVQSGMARGAHIERVAHFVSKKTIAAYVRDIGLPHTVVGTVYFMDNLLDAKRGGAMTFPTLSGTLGNDRPMHMLAVDDLGAIVARIFAQPDRFMGQYVDIASDLLTVADMKAAYSRVTGDKPRHWKLPHWLLRLANRDFAAQLAWQRDVGWTFSPDAARAIYPGLTPFETFVRQRAVRGL